MSTLQHYELFNEHSQCFFYNLKPTPIQRMLDFDTLSKRETPSVAAVVHPGRSGFHKAFFGSKEILIPIYSTIQEAIAKHPNVDSFINFASLRSAYGATKQILEFSQIRTITIVAEGVPQRQTRELIALAKEKGKTLIGPSTVGAIVAGKFRVGHAGGENKNIIRAKLYQTGSVGLVSISGAMMNELFNVISRAANGVYEGVCVGGDTYPGGTLLDHILRYEKNPHIKMIVALSELGGTLEYDIIKAKQEGRITKPLVMWVSGTCADLFPFEVQFGHAAAKAGRKRGNAQEKNQALREAGIVVPDSFEEFENTIKKTFESIEGVAQTQGEAPTIPQDYGHAKKQGLVRKSTNIITTISNDTGSEPTYNGIPLSKLVESGKGIGHIIGLLWFKKELPDYFSKFLELCTVLIADHGSAVSGAHNAIVAARAGKDTISSLASGLLTIGPRFGGATDAACQYFKENCDSNVAPYDFVANMKKKGINIPGIGHRVKSKSNPDKRVEILKSFAKDNFPSSKYLEYALEVEEITLKKIEKLILNVDGCMAALFLDALESSNIFSKQEIGEIVKIGYMNGLFALARSIGIIGHIFDQKRLGERLYRHPTDDILYTN